MKKAASKKSQGSSNSALKKEDFQQKLKKVEEKWLAEQEKNKEYLNRLKYLQADFENYRKRVEKEFKEVIQRGNERLVTRLVEIVDDLETAISTAKVTKVNKAFLDGIKIVHKKLIELLKKEGLEPLDAVGKPFDPNIHEVLAEVPTRKHERGIVLEEVRKGFLFKGKILRPSIVKIANGNSEGEKND